MSIAVSKSNRIVMMRIAVILSIVALVAPLAVRAGDLDDVKKAGVLRHLGIPYAHFVTGGGDGMDVELMQLFATQLGVKYEYVKTDWAQIFGDLTGTKVRAKGDDIEVVAQVPIRGDIAANGITVLPWRRKAVEFGSPTFPTQVWLLARADSPLHPVRPSGSLDTDIGASKHLLVGRVLQGKANTCLDPALYNIDATGAHVKMFNGSLNELAPALINGEAELTLLDVPDALVALQKFPGKVKILGPVSAVQEMAPAFRKDSPKLKAAYEHFLAQARADGTLERLARKYYPFVFEYYPDFFRGVPKQAAGPAVTSN
jgi:ABC-type amino acid transport substrate-binding protein